MDSLREKVAHDICIVDCGRVTENELDRCRGLADAAIAAVLDAMREPSKKVLASGYIVSEHMAFIGDDTVQKELGLMWRTMLDAFLQEQSAPADGE